MFVSHRKHVYEPLRPVTGIALFSYIDYVRTSEETRVWTTAASYGDSFTLLF
jgi:hypothetical protein